MEQDTTFEQILLDDQPMTPEPLMVQPPKTESIKVETPIGGIESDSGSHIVDIITIVGIIVMLYVGKKLVDRYIRK